MEQVPAKYDVLGFAEIKEALTAQSISEAEQFMYWQLIAGVLLLGNVIFDPNKVRSLWRPVLATLAILLTFTRTLILTFTPT